MSNKIRKDSNDYELVKDWDADVAVTYINPNLKIAHIVRKKIRFIIDSRYTYYPNRY